MKSGILLVLLAAAALPVSAQSNQVLDRLLDEPQARFGDVVYMTMVAARLVPETATPEQAIQALQEQNWKVAVHPAEAPILLGDYSYLLMRAFKLQGGIFYRIFPGPRYACRELGFLGVIPGAARPLRAVSGEEAVRILSNFLGRTGTPS